MSTSTVVIGAQWGDEGKGKVTDVMAEKVSAVARFSGGPNAGHTLSINGRKAVLHLLPSALFRPDVLKLVGPGVVSDPEVLSEELQLAEELDVLHTVHLDVHAPIILPIHRELDKARESLSGKGAIGTTQRGIGPCYEDFVARRGPSLQNLRSAKALKQAMLDRRFYDERSLLVQLAGIKPSTVDQMVEWCMERAKNIVPALVDTREVISRLRERGDSLLFEGAQGIMLDVFNGTRPYCTSSICGPAAISASLGVHSFDRVIGVSKAYTTRVGNGPFPTELTGQAGHWLRKKGNEYGATTGRDRRTGWLDLPALRYACRMGGITDLIITKLDILTDIEKIRVAVAYSTPLAEIGPHRTLDTELLERVEPVYQDMDGWQGDLKNCSSIKDLPSNAKKFLWKIEEQTGLPIIGVSVGPDREDMVWKE